MKYFLSVFSTLSMLVLPARSSTAPIQTPPEAVANQFQAVWREVTKDALSELPQENVSFRKLASRGTDIILGNSKRTQNEHANILIPFDKLANPNGICFRGEWNIDTDNEYSGYFQNRSKGLIIARASTALSKPKRGNLRAFGFAGKLFPTMNPSELLQGNTANLFLIDDLGGTKAEHYTDVAMTNEPDATVTSVVFKSFLYALKISRTFAKADKNPRIRQVYEISQLGEINHDAAITPRWMKLHAKQGQTVEAMDFRDELKITEGEKLEFLISVSSAKNDDKIAWETIGAITLSDSVVSQSCYHRLHFHHPVWKEDLNH